MSKTSLIPRERAVCIFFNESYNPSVANFYLSHIDEYGLLEICCDASRPMEPILMAKKRIYSAPDKYLIYPHGKVGKIDVIKFKIGQTFK